MKQTADFSLEEILKNDKIRHLRPHSAPRVGRKASVRDAVEAMRKTRRGCVLVCHGKDLVGILTERDILIKLPDNSAEHLSQPVEAVMTPTPQSVSINDSILSAIRLMIEKGFRHLPVIGDDGAILGTISIRNVLAYLAEHFPQAVYNLPPVPGQINVDRDGA